MGKTKSKIESNLLIDNDITLPENRERIVAINKDLSNFFAGNTKSGNNIPNFV